MFYQNHNPPHFHARYGQEKATIRIDDLSLLNGYLSPRALGLVIEWAVQHKAELLENWSLACSNKALKKIKLYFENGKAGVVDFIKYVKKGGLFARLEDMEYFKNFKINEALGVITWGDEIDIAPETLYSAATGEPLPAWMTKERVG